MKQTNRRSFLRTTLSGVGGLTLASSGVLGTNERVRFALVGCGGRGRILARGLIENGAELVYLCDLHEGRLGSTAQEMARAQGRKPGTAKDVRARPGLRPPEELHRVR